MHQGITQHPYFVQWIAIFPFDRPKSMHKEVIQDENHVIEESDFKGLERGAEWRLCGTANEVSVIGEVCFNS